jgi:hypothetical protein
MQLVGKQRLTQEQKRRYEEYEVCTMDGINTTMLAQIVLADATGNTVKWTSLKGFMER